jgi:hypothetical protein
VSAAERVSRCREGRRLLPEAQSGRDEVAVAPQDDGGDHTDVEHDNEVAYCRGPSPPEPKTPGPAISKTKQIAITVATSSTRTDRKATAAT